MKSNIDFRTVAKDYLSANTESYLYFLLDHSGLPGLHRELIRGSLEWSSLFQGTKEHKAIHAAPILALIGANGRLRVGQPLLDWIDENGAYSSTVIMIASALTMEPLLKRLVARLDVRLSENMKAMLRFYDPRVFEQLIKVLYVEQATTFFSPAQKWWYVDRTAELMPFEAKFSRLDELQHSLTLNEMQEISLIAASEPDQVLGLLRENIPNLIIKLPLANQYEFVVRNIQAATNIGLNATSDFVLYTAVALAKGEDFTNGTLWTSLLSDVSTSRVSFAEAIAEIDNNEELEGV